MSLTRPLSAVTLAVAASTPLVALHAAQPDPADWEASLTAPWAAPGTPPAHAALRAINPEYDFMARTFTVLALADRALAEPDSAADRLTTIDAILDDTLAQDALYGPRHWLLPYADARPWRAGGRSLFGPTQFRSRNHLHGLGDLLRGLDRRDAVSKVLQ